jgi:hypothetical protein
VRLTGWMGSSGKVVQAEEGGVGLGGEFDVSPARGQVGDFRHHDEGGGGAWKPAPFGQMGFQVIGRRLGVWGLPVPGGGEFERFNP